MHIGPASVVETLCTEVVGDGGENGDIISTDLGVSIKDMIHERAWIKSDIFSVQVMENV